MSEHLSLNFSRQAFPLDILQVQVVAGQIWIYYSLVELLTEMPPGKRS